MKTKLIFTITLLSILVFGCRKPFEEEVIQGPVYTVSGYLKPYAHLPDYVLSDTTILIEIDKEVRRKQDSSFYSRLGTGLYKQGESIRIETDSNGYFTFEYNWPDQSADSEYPFYNIVSEIFVWVENGNQGLTEYGYIRTGCNIVDFDFKSRDNPDIGTRPQGTCN